MVGGGDPSTWNFGSTDLRWSQIVHFEPIIARSASAVTPSEKSSINTNMKSPACFPMSLRCSSYVAHKSPKGGSKNKTDVFPFKIALRLKIGLFCHKLSLCENCQRQSCKAFIILTIRSKIIVGNVPFYLKFWVKLTALERNRRFLIYLLPYRLSRNS